MKQYGTIHSINVRMGGVPKQRVESASVTTEGVEGDKQAHPEFHGGPTRAVSLFGLDVIERLRADGHPIAPGSTGENITISGVDWARVPIGAYLHFEDGVVLEALSFAQPCSTIKASFTNEEITLVHQEHNPGQSRIYSRVVVPGSFRIGEAARIESS